VTAELRLHACTKPDCDRLTSVSSLYCCAPCANADRPGRQFELEPWHEGALPYLTHSPGCEARHAERGPADGWEIRDLLSGEVVRRVRRYP
jgi:hypothetical protein